MLNGMMRWTTTKYRMWEFCRINGLVSSTKEWRDKKVMGVVD